MYKNITIQSLQSPLFHANGFVADVLRLDLIHPVISGNKWFKLKYHVKEAIEQNSSGIVSFGGAFSNHLAAMAFCCNRAALPSAAIIRGEEPPVYNPTLNQLKESGTRLVFVSRQAYRNKEQLTREFLAANQNYYVIPEGGQSPQGIKGASEIMQSVQEHYTHIVCAVGTGTTLAGIVNATVNDQQVIGVSSMKTPDTADNELIRFVNGHTTNNNFKLLFNYHFGGYAKKNSELIRFMNDLYSTERIPTDFVYTGKLFYAVYDLTQKNYFPSGSRILIIHSGGLQGNRSLPEGMLYF